jgi:hypothetical protein
VHQLRLQITHEPDANLRIHGSGSSSAKVDGGQAQGLIHWHQKISRPQNSPLRPERFIEQLPEHDAYILYGVVLIHFEIALNLELKIKAAMMGEKFDHMIEKTDPGRDLVPAVAIDNQDSIDVSFFGSASKCGSSHGAATLFD